MKIHYIITYLMLIYSATLLSTSSTRPVAAQELSSVVEWTDSLRLDEPNGIYTVSPQVRIDSSRFIVTDFEEAEVRLYTRSGELKMRFGQKGTQAPGALLGPSAALPLSSGHFVVPDILNGNISLFDDEGNFLERHERVVAAGTNQVHNLPGKGVLLMGSKKATPGSHPLLHRLIPQAGRIEDSFFPHPIPLGSYGDYLFSTGEITKADVKDSTIVASFVLLPKLYFFDTSGTLEQEVALQLSDFRRMEPPDKQIDSREDFFHASETHSIISELFWLNDNVIILQYNDTIDIERGKTRYNLAAVTPKGEVLFEITDTPELFAVDPERQELIFSHPAHDFPNHWIIGHLKDHILESTSRN